MEHAEDPGGAGESAAHGGSGIEDGEPGDRQAVKDEQAAMIEAPQRTKFQAAPCQRPPMIIVSIRLR